MQTNTLSKSTYQCWSDMKQRCLNGKHKAYKDYGGRGITVCDEWIFSFKNFLDYMGEKLDGLSLDRIDNNKGYSPENCRWATTKTQNRNTRKNVYIEYQGKNQTIIEWSEETGIDDNTIMVRYNKGLPLDKVFSKQRLAQTSPNKGNKTGYLGVYPHKNKFKAIIKINKTFVYLGLFNTPELASAAYLDAKKYQKLRELNHDTE